MLIGLGERRALVCLSGLLERGEQITSLRKTNEKMGASDQKWSSQVFEREIDLGGSHQEWNVGRHFEGG